MNEMRLTATRESLEEVNAFLEEEMEKLNTPPRVAMQMLVALEELYVNIASYAYAPEYGGAIVTVHFDEAEDMLYVTLTDWGKPFDPIAKQDPDTTLSAQERKIGGLGIYMVKKSMDIFNYERKDGANIVTFGRKVHSK